MRLSNFIACSLFQVFFGFMLFQYVACDCEFPDYEFLYGKIIYQSPSDLNETYARDLYILQFECNRGFQLNGKRYVQCIDTEWIPEIPFCSVMKCSGPPMVGNATHEVKVGTSLFPILSSYVEYTCNEGYKLEDKEAFVLRCVLSRNSKMAIWVGKMPSCSVHCEQPPEISHGIVRGYKEGDHYLPYEEAQVLCEPGYECNGPEFVVCGEGGEWESEFAECKEIFCDSPAPLANGTILELQSTNLTSFPYNFKLTYVCDQNYSLIGDSRRVCGKKGYWTGRHPTCQVLQCPDPSIPEHGYRMAGNYAVGSVVRFTCFKGYYLLGSSERHCLTNGQWSGNLTRCNWPTNYCPNPGIPIRGSKNSTNYNLGSVIGFRCQDGYNLLGSETRECLPDHNWSGTETKCLSWYDFDIEECMIKSLGDQMSERGEEQETELDKCRKLKLVDSNHPVRKILYFIFDVSESIRRRNFDLGIEFAKTIVNKVGISENGSRAGALTFDSTAEAIFSPLYYHTTHDVLNALDGIEYKSYETARSSPFDLLRMDFIPLVEAVLGRRNIKSFVFVITDGKRHIGGNPKKEVDLLRDAGIDICFIGVTGDMRMKNLYDIAGKSKNQHGVEYSNVYVLQNYPTLSWLVQEIITDKGWYDFHTDSNMTEKTGDRISERGEKQQKELDKNRKLKLIDLNYPGRLILYFLFDDSRSIGRRNFKRGIEFAKAIVNKVGISENGARAGALTFGSTDEMILYPPEYHNTRDVLNALDRIEYRGGVRNMDPPFHWLRYGILPRVDAELGKRNIKSFVFVITNGKGNMGGSIAEEVDDLKKDGIDICCIGVTGCIRLKNLYAIASKSKNQHGVEYSNVYFLRNYATLSSLVQEIINDNDYSQCGLRTENVGTGRRRRIVGGQQNKDSWPWMAALFMRNEEEIPPKYELNCGGSIIHRNFILTAAHCFDKDLDTNPVMRDKKSIIIKLGLTDQKNETFVQESEILNVFIHPRYRPGNLFDYDIALLQMVRPAEYNAYVRPICLPPRELPEDSPLYKPNSSAWATGWGHNGTINRGNIVKVRFTEILKELYLPIQSKERCIESIRSHGMDVAFFTDRMFCAGDGSGGSDTCQGDSGGPLIQAQTNAEGYVYWTQVGIISFGIGCGMPNTYGYYTHLQRLVPWVEETIENALKVMGI